MGSLRKSWRNSMLCYLMKGSNVLKRGKRIGLRKEDASGCKRREMKSRDEETKLLKKARQAWEEQEKERIEAEKSQRENDVKNRDRMQRMIADKDVYLDGLLKERKNIFEKKLEEFNAMLSDERKQRLEKRKE